MRLKNVFVCLAVLVLGWSVIPFSAVIELQGELDSPEKILQQDWWSTFRHDEHRTGASASVVYEKKNILFAHPIGSGITTPPVVYDSSIYVGTSYGKIYCLDATTGEEKWNFYIGYQHSIETPLSIKNGKIFFTAGNITVEKVYAVDLTTQKEVWSKPVSNFVEGSPLVVGGTVIVCTVDGTVYAFDENTGAPKWQKSVAGRVSTSPSYDSNTIFIGTWNDLLYALAISNGDILWTFPTAGGVCTSPVVSNGRIIIGAANDTEMNYSLYSIDIVTRAYWNITLKGPAADAPGVANGKIFILSSDGMYVAVNEADGSEYWPGGAVNETGGGPVVAANNKLVIGTMEADILLLEATTGDILWQFKATDSIIGEPVIAMQRIYAASGDMVYCFGKGNPYLTVRVSPAKRSVLSNEEVLLTVEVTEPVYNQYRTATLVFSSEPAGEFGPYTEVSTGYFECFFTAPEVTQETVCKLRVVANYSGFNDGIGNAEICILPLPEMRATIVAPLEISSEGSAGVEVRVTRVDGTYITSGATVHLTATTGTLLQNVGGAPGGVFSTRYTAPLVSKATKCSFYANVTHPEYRNASAQFNITIIPRLIVELIVNQTVLEGMTASVIVTVSDGISWIKDAFVTMNATTGTFSRYNGMTDSEGKFITIYTAPSEIVSPGQKFVCKITANASKPGYVNGSKETSITIHDKSTKLLAVSLDAEPPQISPSMKSNLLVKVTAAGTNTPVEDAYVALWCEKGSVTDTVGFTNLDGIFRTTFNPPQVSNRILCRITVSASKEGWQAGGTECIVTVDPTVTLKNLSVSVAPADNRISMRNTTTITVEVTEEGSTQPVENANIEITVSSGSVEQRTGVTNATGKFSTKFAPPWLSYVLQETICFINVSVTKTNYNSGRGHGTITVFYKNTKPICKITSPADGAVVSGKVTITGTASDADGDLIPKVEIRIDPVEGGAPVVNWTQVTGTAVWDFTWDTESTPNGKYKVCVRTFDSLEQSLGFSITLEVKNEKPIIPGFETVFIAVAIVIAIILRKLKRKCV